MRILLSPAAEKEAEQNQAKLKEEETGIERQSASRWTDRGHAFHSVVGCLQHLVGGSRRDLATAVHVHSSSLSDENNAEIHWWRAQHVLRYVNGTRSDGKRMTCARQGATRR